MTEVEPTLVSTALSGGKRANICRGFYGDDDWWIGFGKDQSCQLEGTWRDLAILAAKILRHANTREVAPNLYSPDLPISPEQEANY